MTSYRQGIGDTLDDDVRQFRAGETLGDDIGSSGWGKGNHFQGYFSIKLTGSIDCFSDEEPAEKFSVEESVTKALQKEEKLKKKNAKEQNVELFELSI